MWTQSQQQRVNRVSFANAQQPAALSPRAAIWVQSHPAEFDWIVNNSDTFDFAASLLLSLRKWGSLTQPQLAAVQRCIHKKQAQTERHANAPTVSLDAVEQAFGKAKSAGVKSPKLRLDAFTFSPAKETSKNAGAIYVKEGDTYLGKVLGGKLFASSVCTPQQEQLIIDLSKDPLAAAVAYGKRFGKCSVCNRALSDEESVNRGIGPVCASRFGW